MFDSSKIREKLPMFFESQEYSCDALVIYEKQIPFVAFYIVTGAIELVKANKVVTTVTTNNFVAISELIKDVPFKYTARVLAGSQLYIIDRTSIRDLNKYFGLELEMLVNQLNES